MGVDVEASWLAALRAGADVPPPRPRVPLRAAGAGDAVIGSVEPGVLSNLAPLALPDGRPLLEADGGGWRVHGALTASLARVAAALHAAGLAHAWRDEQLAVTDPLGRRLGTVERAVVRVLGITTHAVHLVGTSPEGQVWVQQRSLSKANDPGLWDTLMGGMVSAADTLESALARETWEEAGLRPAQLRNLAYGGRLTTRRPAGAGGGGPGAAAVGYVVEHIDWFCCLVPGGVTPVNQDGEVERFALVERSALWPALQRGEYTTEAALILCDALCPGGGGFPP